MSVNPLFASLHHRPPTSDGGLEPFEGTLLTELNCFHAMRRANPRTGLRCERFIVPDLLNEINYVPSVLALDRNNIGCPLFLFPW
jgi:hypothetical protein